jgi:hypothetical protein
MKVWLRIVAAATTSMENAGGDVGPVVTVGVGSRLYVVVHPFEADARAARKQHGGLLLGVEASELNQPQIEHALQYFVDTAEETAKFGGDEPPVDSGDVTVQLAGGYCFHPEYSAPDEPTPEQTAWMEQFEKESGITDWTI